MKELEPTQQMHETATDDLPLDVELLLNLAKWARTFSIVMLTAVGLVLVASTFTFWLLESKFSEVTNFLIIELFLDVVISMPMLYLLKTSKDLRKAAEYGDSHAMHVAFDFLRSYFKFFAIFFILCFVFSFTALLIH